MNISSIESFIHCSTDLSYNHLISTSDPEVYFSETADLLPAYPDLKKYISVHEHSRSDKFHFNEDRQTFICCHALLRLLLSKMLNMQPSEISYVQGRFNKPFLKGNPVHFNITHTRNAFAIAISKYSYIGIDLENVNRKFDFRSVEKMIFNSKERLFISESHEEARDRFFLLWTRKEAFLKAIGLGIITNMKQIGVHEQKNLMNKKLLEKFHHRSCNDHFIYSGNIADYSYSVSVPQISAVNVKRITADNLHIHLV